MRLSILVTGTFFVFSSLFFIGCENKTKKPAVTPEKVELKQSFKKKMAEKNAESVQLLEYACLYCHELQDSNDATPSILSIRDVYKKANPVKDDFVALFVAFSNQTVQEPLLMKSKALEQCGLMQKDSEHAEQDVKDIAAYIFDYKAN